jgi:hypothetical protein
MHSVHFRSKFTPGTFAKLYEYALASSRSAAVQADVANQLVWRSRHTTLLPGVPAVITRECEAEFCLDCLPAAARRERVSEGLIMQCRLAA